MKTLNIIGLIIFGIGMAFLIGSVLVVFFKDSGVPISIKVGISSLGLGGLIILISLIGERIKDKKQEKL